MAIANVTLNNTFDEWRTTTNQLISFVNDVDAGNLTKFYSNSAVLTVTENVARNGKNFITLNTSSSVLDTSTLNVATANAVNIVFAALANTDARLILVSNDANAINSVANAALIQANIARSHANAAFLAANNFASSVGAGANAYTVTVGDATNSYAVIIGTASNTYAITIGAAGNSYTRTIGTAANTIAISAYNQSNSSFDQANAARSHANAAFLAANSAVTDYSPASIQANTARTHANVSFEQANTARVHANGAFLQANLAYELASFASGNNANTLISNKAAFDQANSGFAQANTARDHANAAHASANAGLTQANAARSHANAAFLAANAALPNTSGASFAGNIQVPTGNLSIGIGSSQGESLYISRRDGFANIFAEIATFAGGQFTRFNSNTNFGGWNDLTLNRDHTIIFSNGGVDDKANLMIGPWTDSSFGYKQDGEGRHGFNTSNPRYELDANGSANISGSLILAGMNVSPTVIAAHASANAGQATANAAFNRANTANITADRAWNHANAAFVVANTANITADRAWNHANAAFATANIAFANANTVMVSAQAAFTVANSGFLHANAAYAFANSISTTANIAFANANTVMVSAQAAFTVANSGFLHANAGFASANAGLLQANTARDHANAAFAKANTGAGTVIIDTDSLNATRYIMIGDKTSGTLANANVATALTYNPSTGTLSSTVFNSTSDINKKDNIVRIEDAVNKVEQLNGVSFTWKDSGYPSAGLIAQDLAKVMPELVASDMSVTYSGVIGLLVEAIKELNERIKDLENK